MVLGAAGVSFLAKVMNRFDELSLFEKLAPTVDKLLGIYVEYFSVFYKGYVFVIKSQSCDAVSFEKKNVSTFILLCHNRFDEASAFYWTA